MSQNEQIYQQLQAYIDELEAQYLTLQGNYDDEILLCVSVLRTLVNDDYEYTKSLVKRAGCSTERMADALQFIEDVRNGH
ncbi:hypothetical protein D3C81_1695300 [compost metagenome]|jgi:hypothetical protein